MSSRIKTFKSTKFSGSKFNYKAAADSLYDSEKWKKYSAKFLSINDRCYCCGDKSQVTDHIVAHKGDVSIFWKVDNYIPLCSKCHNIITARFDRHYRQKYTEKLQWLSQERSRLELTFKIKVVPFN